jgi:hypothetical protein
MWAEFRDRFRAQHMPAGLMKLKRMEFLSLKQDSMSMSKYHDRFIQLSHYAPADVDEDHKKQDLFMDGLNDALQYHLMNHRIPTFHDLVDRALLTEKKCREMMEDRDRKRKLPAQQVVSSSRPRYSSAPQFHASGQRGYAN